MTLNLSPLTASPDGEALCLFSCVEAEERMASGRSC